jgi:hypothetical protein
MPGRAVSFQTASVPYRGEAPSVSEALTAREASNCDVSIPYRRRGAEGPIWFRTEFVPDLFSSEGIIFLNHW